MQDAQVEQMLFMPAPDGNLHVIASPVEERATNTYTIYQRPTLTKACAPVRDGWRLRACSSTPIDVTCLRRHRSERHMCEKLDKHYVTLRDCSGDTAAFQKPE